MMRGVSRTVLVLALPLARAWIGPPQRVALTRDRLSLRASSSVYSARPSSKGVPVLARTLAGAGILGAIDQVARTSLAGTGAPASLVAGGATLAALSATRGVGAKFHERWLAPGATLLLTWMAAFFAPNLVLLPTAKPVAATSLEACALVVAVVGGLFATLLATAFATQFFDERSGLSGGGQKSPTDSYFSSLEKTTTSPPPRKRRRTAFGPLVPLSALTAASFPLFLKFASPATATALFAFATLAAYVVGARTNSKILEWADDASAASAALRRSSSSSSTTPRTKAARLVVQNGVAQVAAKVAHPVVLCAGLVLALVQVAAQITGVSLSLALELYASTGGAALQRLLGPCVVALACGVYDRRRDMLASWRAVSSGVLLGSTCGVYGTALLVKLLDLSDDAKLALLTRCITTPLAMPVLASLGGDPATAFSIIVVTGILGAAFGPAVLDACKITNPKARGLAMGCAAHGIGTAQMGAYEPNAQPYASIGMAVAGSAMVVLALLGPTQTLFLKLAGLPA